jgi:hypothetical protein
MKTKEEIEQLAEEAYPNHVGLDGIHIQRLAFKVGYYQCQEDMADKKYTEEDVRKAINLARKTIVNKWGANGEESIDFAHSNTKIMQSINKQD